MEQRRWIKYVHWLGYLTSVIVTLQVLFLGYLGAAELQRRSDRREYTQMHDGVATDRLNAEHFASMELALLNALPSPSALAPNGIRFVAVPSFGDTYFAVALRQTSEGGEGLMIMKPRDAAANAGRTVPIKLSANAYARLTSELDGMSSTWGGDSGWWLDGTSIVFERILQRGTKSGFGNSPDFYGKIGALIFEALRPTTPQLAKFDISWHLKGRRDKVSANGS